MVSGGNPEKGYFNEPHSYTQYLPRLLKTKAGEDPGFEIIKEVPGNSGSMPRMGMGGLMGGLMGPGGMQGMFKDAGLGGMMGNMLAGQGLGALGNPNMMKCKHYKLSTRQK